MVQPKSTLDLTDDEALALAQLLRRTINDDRYPMSPRLAPLKAILAKLDQPKPASEPPPLPARHAPSGAGMKPYRGPPMTLGNAAAAMVRLIVWCRDCGRQVEPDPGEMAERYGAETMVIDWHARLVCCGSLQAHFVVTGTEPRLALREFSISTARPSNRVTIPSRYRLTLGVLVMA